MEKGKRTMNPDNKKRKIDSEVGASTLAEEEEQVPDYKLDDIMYKEEKYFSQSAIHSLKNYLLGEEEENFQRKSVFLWVFLPYSSRGYNFEDGWLKIHVEEEADYHKTLIPSVSFIDGSMKDQGNAEFPPELLDLKNYGCAVRNSQIIIAGGLFQPDDDVCNVVLSDRVYTYDTVSKKWGRLSNMVAERPATPTVAVADNKIFVIDGNPQHDSITYREDPEEQDKLKIPLWAEYYDFAQNSQTPPKWDKFYILPPTYLVRYPHLSYCAVYPKGSLVLFNINCSWVVSFNYSTWAWNVYKADETIAQCPRWSESVVVLDHFLFCHHYETIYGHDLSNGTTHPVYTFNDTSTHFGLGPVYDFKSFYYSPPLTFLIHLGNNELCLLWLEKTNTIRYFMFRVQIFMGAVEPATLHLVLSSTGLLEAPATEIGLALEVSSSV